MQDGLGNRGQGARGPRWQRLNHRLQRRTLNSRRLNTPSDLSPPLSCSRKAGVLATFSPSRSLTSEEPLILVSSLVHKWGMAHLLPTHKLL